MALYGLKPRYCQIDPTTAQLLNRFDHTLEIAKRSANTRRNYRRIVATWSLGCDELLKPSAASFYAWLRHRKAVLAVGSLNLELSALRCFYRWCSEMEYTPTDFSTLLPRSHRAPKRLVRVLDEWQIGALLAAPDLATPIGLRDHAMLRVTYELGLRARDVIALRMADISMADGLIYIGKDRRPAPCSAALAGLLQGWLTVRRQLRPGKQSAVFITQHGRAFTQPRALWEIMARYSRQALGNGLGYTSMVRQCRQRPWSGQYPHLLRASMTQHLLQRGADWRQVQELLGITNIATLARYLAIDIAALKEAHAHHPRSAFIIDTI
jgi:site-specific recombinase XerD